MRCRLAAFVGVIGLSFSFAAFAQSPADDIANRFAEPAAKPGGTAGSDEQDMLERARREALERAEADQRQKIEAEARQRDLEAQREAEARALSEKLKRAEEARQARSAPSPVEETSQKPFKPALTSQDKSVTPATGIARSPLVIRPPQEPVSVSERPHDAAPVGTALKDPETLPPPMALGRPAAVPPSAIQTTDPRVTILLVMEPGKKGIRRFNKSADPVVCAGLTCFISNGAGAPASMMDMRRALGPGNTFGQRAGACRGKLGCVFRGVALAGPYPTIQPIDLKVLVHDRREPRTVSGDTSCHVVAGRLSCGRMVVAPGYRAWIVPEGIAQEAGPQALEAAVLRGLVAAPLREAAVSR
jgi:colicin import membrane protein